MKKFLVKGKSIEEILESVSEALNVDKGCLKYEITGQKKGVFGFGRELEVKIWAEKIEHSSEMEKQEEIVEKEKVVEERNMVEEYFEVEVNKEGVNARMKKRYEGDREGLNSLMLDSFLYLDMRGVLNYDMAVVRKVFTENRTNFLKIADYDENYYVDAKVKIDISEDKMEGRIEIIRPERGNDIKRETVEDEIAKSGIKYGINSEILNRICSEKIYGEKIVFAVGELPENGEDARVVYRFDEESEPQFLIDDFGRVDFKTIINKIKNITRGEVIAEKVEKTNGKNGRNIFGEEVAAVPGKDIEFNKGINVIEGMNENQLISMIDGRIGVVEGKINIFPVLEVEGDVDLKSGNINFAGAVTIKGNVRDGFKVVAKGDIIIGGLVEDAIIESESNIYVQNGIMGKENESGYGYVKAGGILHSKFLQNIRVESKRGIEVSEHILNSYVQSEGKVMALSGKGKILGGRIISGIEIRAKEIGNVYGVKTELEIGATESFQILKYKIENELREKVEELQKFEMGLKGYFDTLYWKNPELDKVKYLEELKKGIIKLSAEKNRIDEQHKKSLQGSIYIKDSVYHGVSVKIGGVQSYVKEKGGYLRYFLNEKKEISFGSYEEERWGS